MTRESGANQPYLVQLDYLLVLFVLVTTALGLLVLAGSTYGLPDPLGGYTVKQAEWWGVSLAVFVVALAIPYRWLKGLGWPFYLGFLLALALLAVASKTGWTWGDRLVKRGGAFSWMHLRRTDSWLIQPSEFMKIAVVIVLAHWLAWRQKHLTNIWECIVPLALASVPFALVALQPNLGTAMVFVPLPFILLFSAGLHWRVVLLGIGIGILGLGAGLYAISTAETTLSFLRPYQVKRIVVFRAPLEDTLRPIFRPFQPAGVEETLAELNADSGQRPSVEEESAATSPDAVDTSHESAEARREAAREARKAAASVWQIQQAEMALGSGKVFGKGWGKGTQSREGFLPAHYTDFIFCSLGEQFGMAGCLLLLGLYLLIAWRALHVAVVTTDPFGKCLVIGLLSVILLHVFFNVGMTVRLLPVTGLPLPLVSYGGSFLATNYLILGLIANVSMRR